MASNSLISTTQKVYPASLLLNFDGSNNSTTFTDSSVNNHSVSIATGSPVISTTQSKFGGSSLYLNGSSSLYINSNTSFNLTGEIPYTIEFWMRMESYANYYTTILTRRSGINWQYIIGFSDPANRKLYFSAISGTQSQINTNEEIPLQQWVYVAACVKDGQAYLFIDGELRASGTWNTQPDNSSNFYIGQQGSGGEYFNGYIDSLRVTKGAALYTGSAHPIPNIPASNNAIVAPLLKNHIVMTSTKSSGDISGYVSTDSGYYTVNWWDGTKTTYSSGTNFAKAAIAGSKLITIFPSTSNGTLSGLFYNVDVSNNNLTSVRAFYSRFITSAGYQGPGFSTPYQYWYTPTGGWRWRSTYVPGAYVPGSMYSLNIAYNNLDSTALNQLYTDLLKGTGTLEISDNTGADNDDPSIATSKGYTVYGSLSGSTELLLNLDGTNGSTTFTDSSSNSRSITLQTGSPSLNTTTKKYGTAALNFNSGAIGNNSYIIPDLSNMDWSIEFWIYRPTATAAYEGLVYLANSSGVDNNSGVNIHLYTSNDIHFNNNGTVAVTSTTNVTSGVWHHVACVSINNEKRVYFNGVLMGRAIQATAAGPYQIKIGRSYGYWANSASTAYIDDFKLVRGKSIYTADFVPPTSALTTSTTSATPGITVLLLKGNGTNGSTTFTDDGHKNLTPTVNGNAQISTAQKKYGTGSAYFDGAGDYLLYSTGKDNFNLFNSNFTMECWIRPSVGTGVLGIFCKRDPNTTAGLCFYVNNGKLGFVATSDNGSWNATVESSALISANTWYHVALTRLNDTFKIFIDGTEVGSITASNNFVIASNSYNVFIGSSDGATGSQFFNGYIDDFRLIRGVSLYNYSFTPPSSELTIYP